MFFQEDSICSSNKPFYLIEQILISQKSLSSPRTASSWRMLCERLLCPNEELNALGPPTHDPR